MVAIIMVSAKMATLGLLIIKVFWNKGYDAKFISMMSRTKFFHLIVDLAMWLKFGNSIIYMREVIIT